MTRRLALLGPLALLLCGCAASGGVVLGPPPDGPPAPALAVAPIRVDYQPTKTRPLIHAGQQTWKPLVCVQCGKDLGSRTGPLKPCPKCGGTTFRERFAPPYAPSLDVRALQTRVRDVLARRHGFRDVLCLAPAGKGPEDPDRRAARARAAGAAWLLELTVEDAKVELVRHNWLFPVKVVDLIASSLLIFPAIDPIDWFLPDEVYGIRYRLRWRLTDLRRGKLLGSGELRREVEDHFAAFGPGRTRSWFLVGFLRVPGCLEEHDWAGISSQLEGLAADDLVSAAVTAAEGARLPGGTSRGAGGPG